MTCIMLETMKHMLSNNVVKVSAPPGISNSVVFKVTVVMFIMLQTT